MSTSGSSRHPPLADTSTWLTCAESATLLKTSENTIRAWVRQGKLAPRKARRTYLGGGTREVDVFDPSELAAHVSRRRAGVVSVNSPGEIAASAFEMFDAGSSMRDIVISLRETPARVTQLHDEWLDLGGADLVIGKEAKASLERVVGPFSGVADLVRLVSEASRRTLEVTVTDGSPLAQASDADVERAIDQVLASP